jgi:hypothetical protein
MSYKPRTLFRLSHVDTYKALRGKRPARICKIVSATVNPELEAIVS